MAINFPDSPTLNQEFTVGDRVWFWNGTVWKAKETAILETGKYIVSDTAPENPEEGDAWFDSVNTKEFIYYDGYWVETSAAAIGIPATGLATEAYVDTALSGFDSLPDQTGQSGNYLTTDGSTASWAAIDVPPTPLQYFYGLTYGSATGNLIIEYNSIDSSQPALAVSDYDDWFMTNHTQSSPLSFSIVDGHLIMESA
jgi:hypothetical protein